MDLQSDSQKDGRDGNLNSPTSKVLLQNTIGSVRPCVWDGLSNQVVQAVPQRVSDAHTLCTADAAHKDVHVALCEAITLMPHMVNPVVYVHGGRLATSAHPVMLKVSMM